MPDFSVSTAFNSVDRVSKAFKKMGIASDKFKGKATKNFGAASRSALGFGNITKGILGAQAVGQGVALLKRGVGSAVEQYIQFDDAIFGATARFKDAQVEGANVSKIMKQLRVSARAAGSATQFTAAQAAVGLDFFARAGFTSAEAMAVLVSQIDLATATGEDFAQVADQSSDLLGAFGFAALDSAQKVKKMAEMNAVLAISVNSANVKMEDLFETLKISAPIGTKAGIAMRDIVASTAVLGSAGIKGSLAATAMKNIFLRLADPTKEVSKGLKSIGLTTADFVDKQGKMKGMAEIFGLLGDKTKGLRDVEQVALFSKIFGKRAIAGAINLKDNIGGIVELMTKLGKDPQAQLKKMSDFIRQSLGNRILELQSAATELAFKFFSAFDKDGRGGLERLTAAVRAFDVMPIVNGIKTIVTVIDRLSPAIWTVVIALVAYKTVIGAIIAFQAIVYFAKFVKVLFLMAKAKGVVTAATWAWNFALNANPIGLIVSGVAILIGLIVLLVKNWDLVSAALKSAWKWLWKILKFTTPLGLLISGIQSLTGGGDVATPQGAQGGRQTPGREAPNSSEVQAKKEIGFNGRLDIFGAPEGSNFSSETTGANPIKTDLLGANF